MAIVATEILCNTVYKRLNILLNFTKSRTTEMSKILRNLTKSRSTGKKDGRRRTTGKKDGRRQNDHSPFHSSTVSSIHSFIHSFTSVASRDGTPGEY